MIQGLLLALAILYTAGVTAYALASGRVPVFWHIPFKSVFADRLDNPLLYRLVTGAHAVATALFVLSALKLLFPDLPLPDPARA